MYVSFLTNSIFLEFIPSYIFGNWRNDKRYYWIHSIIWIYTFLWRPGLQSWWLTFDQFQRSIPSLGPTCWTPQSRSMSNMRKSAWSSSFSSSGRSCWEYFSSAGVSLVSRVFPPSTSVTGKIRGLLPYQPVYSREMVERIDKIDKIVRSNRPSLSFQPLDCYCNYNYKVRTASSSCPARTRFLCEKSSILAFVFTIIRWLAASFIFFGSSDLTIN